MAGRSSCSSTTTRSACTSTSIDDGRGLEPGFDIDGATGLGLSIVRTLVTTELNGKISMRQATAADRAVGLDETGLDDGSHGGDQGTVVELDVPLEAAT